MLAANCPWENELKLIDNVYFIWRNLRESTDGQKSGTPRKHSRGR